MKALLWISVGLVCLGSGVVTVSEPWGQTKKTKLLISKISLSTQMALLLKKKQEDAQGISAASESKNWFEFSNSEI